MNQDQRQNAERRRHVGFTEDFRRFFLRGLATLLPTLITLWLIAWFWEFLSENLGRHIMWGVKSSWQWLYDRGMVDSTPTWNDSDLFIRFLGVVFAFILVYFFGVFVGNFIGRTAWRLSEIAVMRIPVIRAIYPAVKQVTDFILSDRSRHFTGSRVVAVKPHECDIWSIGLVTGAETESLNHALNEPMVTVFVPSTPTAFSGYVLVVPRRNVVELPWSVEEAMRMLITGGVINPQKPAKSSAELTNTAP